MLCSKTCLHTLSGLCLILAPSRCVLHVVKVTTAMVTCRQCAAEEQETNATPRQPQGLAPGCLQAQEGIVTSSSPVNSSHLISSHLISSHLISSHLISSHLISSHLISSHLISSHLISSHLIPSHFISSHCLMSQSIILHLLATHQPLPVLLILLLPTILYLTE